MTDTAPTPTRTAGHRGARESHEPTLTITNFPEGEALIAPGWTEWDMTGGATNLGMDGNGPNTPGPGPTDPPSYPQGMGNCGYAGPDHGRALQRGDLSLVGTLGEPAFPVPYGAYWAYGVAQGEVGQPPAPPDQPDGGVDNASWCAFLYKAGVLKGYAEVPVDRIGHYAPACNGLLIAQSLPDSAESDFEASPPVPWGSPGEVPDQQEGHDTWLARTHADGTGEMVTWGALQPFTASYPGTFITDAWALWFADDPTEMSAELRAALEELHGTIAPTSTPPTPEPPTSGEPEGLIGEIEHAAEVFVEDLEHLIEGAPAGPPAGDPYFYRRTQHDVSLGPVRNAQG